ncbi:hypothetical protein pipiens_015435, partial [Culex pipiens pipiens]
MLTPCPPRRNPAGATPETTRHSDAGSRSRQGTAAAASRSSAQFDDGYRNKNRASQPGRGQLDTEGKVRRSDRHLRRARNAAGHGPASSSSTTERPGGPDVSRKRSRRCCRQEQPHARHSVKKLLKKLVMDEHVLAIAEAEDPKEGTSKDGTEGDDEDDEFKSLQPKLTRLKAKQLNKQPLPIVPLKTTLPDEEVAALIREELGSDDDDEEYKPTEEDIPSDDDPNTTISDIDSPPRTPAAPTTPGRIEQDAGQDALLYSKDAVSSRSGRTLRGERDRSCASGRAAIETIESTFIPPDITTDMYDFDCDMDLVWKEFLNEFTKPLQNHAEDDDDTDPEYVAADKIP